MPEQKYKFIDITDKCFVSFAQVKDTTKYHKMVAELLLYNEFEVGDMLAFRDDLQADGFEWGKDFYVRKIGNA